MGDVVKLRSRSQRTTPPRKNPFVVERYDEEDGSISYEVWDLRSGSYRRLCTINELDDGGREDENGNELSTAKADAEMIVRALNFYFQKNLAPK